jgi:ketosteroid isomerase-like protein
VVSPDDVPAVERDRVIELLDRSHAAFAAGDADAFAACFAEDARLFLLHNEAAEGRDAIREKWRLGFVRLDTSAWEPRLEMLDLGGGHAHAFTVYTERLLNREDGSRTLVRGRLVHFLRRGADGEWEITMLMNSHSHPMEPIE